MEYSNKFEKICETVISGGIYDFNGVYFSNRGMHLPRINILNDQVDENFIIIDVFN